MVVAPAHTEARARTNIRPERRPTRFPIEHRAVLALATAEDVATGMTSVVALIRHASRATGVEWWVPGGDGELELAASAGESLGSREDIQLGPGLIAVFGGSVDPLLASQLKSVAGILRRRSAEERLAQVAMQLAHRNEALEDFAALVAHELKTPLQAALLADDASGFVEQALDLVGALLEAARDEAVDGARASTDEVLAQVVEDLHPSELEVTSDAETALPVPGPPLRIILRNLVSNALAARARHVHVTTQGAPGWFHIVVDDDGVGLGSDDYGSGNGLGLALSRRVASRFGGALDLSSLPSGGTRAVLTIPEAVA
jgi:signal transduction histidine kinase